MARRTRLAVASFLLGQSSASPLRVSDYIRPAINSSAYNLTTDSALVEPCALVSQELIASDDGKVNIESAYQCLQSVPLHAEHGYQELEGVKIFVEFQSTLTYLKNPSDGYLYPAVDVLSGLDRIGLSLNESVYENEYDFQIDVLDLVQSAYDGHFNYYPDITQVFTFQRDLPLYSISSDGLTLPAIYFGFDYTFLAGSNASTRIVSPVVAINDVPVETWLNEQAADDGNSQDPDASYNSMFNTGPSVARRTGRFNFPNHYPGPTTTLRFANGSTVDLINYATTQQNFSGVVDGSSFFNKFCTLEGSSEAAESTEDEPATPTSSQIPVIPTTQVPFQPVEDSSIFRQISSFPKPVITSDDFFVQGYFPTENPDMAVLAIKSFNTEVPAAYTQFSNTVRMFLATAQSQGKTKLMIDLRGNPGGVIALAYDLFAQLFPNIVPYGATNFRATPLLNDIGEIVSSYYANITNLTATEDDCEKTLFATHPFNHREQLDINNQPFTSWQDYYGPESHAGDNFTSLSRYNLEDPFSLSCLPISNHRDLANITPQVFQPEDIVLVQDGVCASVCAVFTEFMKTQAHVKQVVFGGRKQHGPMQGVGGVKGTNVYSFSTIAQAISGAAELATPLANETYQARYEHLTVPALQALSRAYIEPTSGARLANINVRNNIRLGDESVTPLQFVYEAADCRLFYTAEAQFDQAFVWNQAYQARWNGAPCVQGSTGHPSSEPGSDAFYSPPPEARNFFGADFTKGVGRWFTMSGGE